MFGFCCSPVAVDRILPEIGNSNLSRHKSILKKQRTHGECLRVRSFGMIRISDAASSLEKDSSVTLIHHNPSSLRSLVLIRGWPRATIFPRLPRVVCFRALSAHTTGCVLYFRALFTVSTSASIFS